MLVNSKIKSLWSILSVPIHLLIYGKLRCTPAFFMKKLDSYVQTFMVDSI